MLDKISSLPLKTAAVTEKNEGARVSAAQLSDQFGAFLNDAIANLNNQQATVDKLSDQFVKGELSDVHQLLIASEKSSLGLELTVQVRNKVIEAYQEIMRMQV